MPVRHRDGGAVLECDAALSVAGRGFGGGKKVYSIPWGMPNYSNPGKAPIVFAGTILICGRKRLNDRERERMELFRGRPESTEGRLPREIRTYDFLDSLGIEYLRTDHEPADHMEDCNRIDAVLGVVICKNLYLCNRQKTDFYLLMMPGEKKFKTKEFSKQIGTARLSFADPEHMLQYLDIEPGDRKSVV